MTTLIFGIGIGLFIVITLWLSAGLIFAVSLRTDKKIGLVAIAIAAILSVILVGIPRNSEHPSSKQEKPYDHLFIWRVVLLALLAGSSIIALVGYVKYGLMDQKRPQRITTWIH